MRGYLIPKGISCRLVINGGDAQPWTTTEEKMFFQEHLKIDPVAVYNGQSLEPKYTRYEADARAFVHGFELPGKKHIDTKYLLLVEGKDVIVG